MKTIKRKSKDTISDIATIKPRVKKVRNFIEGLKVHGKREYNEILGHELENLLKDNEFRNKFIKERFEKQIKKDQQ